MAGDKLHNLLSQSGKLAGSQQGQHVPDQELLRRFADERDEGAFAALMERHGGMVLGVCRRVLRNAHDAEDACQAAFLVLARKAGAVRKRGSVGSWLHGVAWRVSRKLRSSLARRGAREQVAADEKPTSIEPADLTLREAVQILDEELNRLPKDYKAPLVVCHLEGRTQDEAARELGWSVGKLRGRLERGRDKLRRRLTRRGVTGSAALAIAALAPDVCSAAVPPTLVVTTVNASLAMAAGQTPPAIPAHVASLARELIRAPLWAGLKIASALAVVLAVFGAIGLFAPGVWWNAEEPAPAGTISAEGWSEAGRLEGHKRHAWCVAFSPDGKRLASGAGGVIPSSGELMVWDTVTGQAVYTLHTPRSVRQVAFAPDGKTLATAEHDGVARLRDAGTGEVLRILKGHKSIIDVVAFARDGKMLATSCWDGTVKLWDPATGDELRTLAGHTGQVFGVAFGPGDMLATGGADGTARIWDARTGQTVRTLKGHHSTVHWLEFSGDGKLLATASWDRTVRLWDPATGKRLATLRGHTMPVLALAFAPDGRTLASSGGEWGNDKTSANVPNPGEVIIWDLARHRLRVRLGEQPDRMFGLSFSPDSDMLAMAGWDGSVRLCKREPGAPADSTTDLEPDRPEEYHLSFKGKLDARSSSVQVIGPGAAQCVRFEPEGLRITLPAGHKGERPFTGLSTGIAVRGDFEATVSYEILQAPEAGASPIATKLLLTPVLDRPQWNVAGLGWTMPKNGVPELSAWTYVTEAAGKDRTRGKRFPAHGKSGRLRLVRTGSQISFYVAENGAADFTFLHRFPFPRDDIHDFRIVGGTGGPKATLDARVTDLRVRTLPAPAAATLTAVDLKGESLQEFHGSFTGTDKVPEGVQLYGPAADQCVQAAADGLHIRLPAGYPGQRPGTGLVTAFGVKGDFEITATFEIPQEPEAGQSGGQTGIGLVIVPHEPAEADVWHKANQNRASLTRRSAGPNHPAQFLTTSTKWNEETVRDQWGNEDFSQKEMVMEEDHPSEAKSGRLRLVRTGTTLSYYVAEGSSDKFTLLRTETFGDKDLKNVRLLASTGGPTDTFDVRLTELRIRASALPRVAQGGFAKGLPTEVLLAGGLLLAVVIGVILSVQHRRRVRRAVALEAVVAEAAPSVVAFRCADCGKNLKAKVELVGKKVKCPQCGKAVPVPATAGHDKTPEESSS